MIFCLQALVQPEWALVVNFCFFDWLEPMPNIQKGGYPDSNSCADEEEPAVRGPCDKNKYHGCHSQDESGDAFEGAHSFI
jgi:hypothetical protein